MPEGEWKVRELVSIGTINLEDSSNVTKRIAEDVYQYIQRNKKHQDSIEISSTNGGYIIELTYGGGVLNKKLQMDVLNKFKKYHICHVGTHDKPLRDRFMIRSDLLTTVRVTHTFLWDCILWVIFLPFSL